MKFKPLPLMLLSAVPIILPGCAQHEAKPSPPAPIIEAVETSSEFDDLLRFGAEMANMTPVKRAEICKALTKQTDTRIHLKLMTGRLLSSHCGNITEIIHQIKTLELNDTRLQLLVAIHTEALVNLLSQRKKPAASHRKSKSILVEPPAKETQETTRDEVQLLRDKLEAIRNVEKQMDESSEGN
ncbi:MAG: hypothetical protein CTY17_06670 [Methylomonas sp.]|nr:MAG: hypothetical protein CTY17_06670 [Methylomonas sp.]